MNLLTSIYGAVAQLRNDFYDRGVLKQRRLSKPVISIGNLSLGGSGKTPFVILLGELLKSRQLQFDVLSRGYGRRTRGVLSVDPHGSPDDFGDEPLLIARRLGCPVVVGEDRYQAGVFAEKAFGVQLHILDDGFQHRSLARDFDIVMLSADDLRDRLLPVGRLREPLDSLRRASAVVTATDEYKLEKLPVNAKAMWSVQRGISISNPPERPVVFCGIARPQKFVNQLQEAGLRQSASKFYRDHHRYSEQDIRTLIELKDKHCSGGFITTEKDAVNLGQRVEQLGRVEIAKVTMKLDQADAALNTLLRVIHQRGAAS
jgi:tetraacyldisaccharide 4'-kinase